MHVKGPPPMFKKLKPSHDLLSGTGGSFDPSGLVPFGGPQIGIPLAEDGASLVWGFPAAAAATSAATTTTTTAASASPPATIEAGTSQAGAIQAGAPGGFVITVNYDSSVASAPAGFKTTVAAVVTYLESLITTSINITINVGYGELNVGGTPTSLASGALGESFSTGIKVSYTTLYTALQAHPTSAAQIAAAASLPITNPTGAGNASAQYYLSYAEAEALGLSGGPGTGAVVGAIGIGTQPMTYGSTNAAAAGTYDAFGVIEHEITEVLGRTASLGASPNTGTYTPLDLFRYSAAGVRALSPGAGYFSIDGGATSLATFNDPNLTPGDAGDWASSLASPDSFNAAVFPSVANPISAADLTVLNVLGYNLASTAANCFAAGTRILTERGEIPVEALAVGDRVVTRHAGPAPIRWIGRRRVDCRRHADPGLVCPVRIAPHAFGPGMPARALRLSPDHAVAVDGALVPIRLLINGGSIAQETGQARLWYFHIELDRHDLVTAEGLPAETYLDTGNRDLFANAPGPLRLHPRQEDAAAQARRVAQSCLPLLCDPAAVEPVWRRLAARSAALGHAPAPVATTRDPALRLRFGASALHPVEQTATRAVFAVPPGDRPAALLSRSLVPAVLRPWLGDRRRLGVRVRGLSVRRGAERIDLAPDDPRLSDGWWAAEHEPGAIWRWTDGAGVLPLACGGALLEIRIDTPPDYPRAADAPSGDGPPIAARAA
jgi:hypothetical protein